MTTITHLRGIPSLRPLRGHHPAVVVCLDDPAPLELHAEHVAPEDAVKTVRWLEMRCEECPQSGVDMALRGGTG
jgi:hypothetical protein